MAGAVGLEPTNDGVKVRCLTNLATPQQRINKMVEGEGFEPSKAVPADLQSAPFGQLGYPSSLNGADNRIRTYDLLITSQLLYQLSYTGEQTIPFLL